MKNSPKLAATFFCEICNYKCCKKSDYNKHLDTSKHINRTNYLLNIKFWGDKDYVARYFNMYPNSEILSRNASMLAIDDYRFSSNRNDNKLFHTNKNLIDLRIRNEDHSRSSLNNILYPPKQNKNQKVNPSEENTQTFFTPNFMSFQNY
jgi:hypothetical protein